MQISQLLVKRSHLQTVLVREIPRLFHCSFVRKFEQQRPSFAIEASKATIQNTAAFAALTNARNVIYKLPKVETVETMDRAVQMLQI
jgi:hypothetical protein